ncbi:MAG: hypothetical protein ACRENG_32045 [bacterium]
MELSDDKLRQIVRETLRELGPNADPALVQKVVREVVRHLMKHGDHPTPSSADAAHLTQQFVLSMFRSSDGTPDDSLRQGY